MKPEDWATVKPFTDLFVDFIQIQLEGQSQMVKCPWCGRANQLPSVSGANDFTTNWYIYLPNFAY